MRLKVWKSLSTILVIVSITTLVLHLQVGQKSHELDSGAFQQLHRRAAGASVRDGAAGSNYGDLKYLLLANPVTTKSVKVVHQEQQQNDNLGNLLQPKKHQSRGGFREMAWANDVPSLSDDGSQAAQNASEAEYQLKLIEKELDQFALQVQQTERDSQSLHAEEHIKLRGQINNPPPTSLNPKLPNLARPSLTIVVKDSVDKLKNPPPAVPSAPSISETNLRKTELNDIYIAVKTTGKYHKSRLDILLDTWVALANEQTYFFTDVADEEYRIRTNNHLINTNCSAQHSRQALCCKTAVIYDTFLKSGKRWFCGVDDDNYLNVKQLLHLLQDYKHLQDVYLGRASLSHPIEAMDRENKMQRVSFWFATGGAGYCISRSLALKMSPYASGGTFKSVCNRIRLPDDVSIGFIIEVLLKHPLTRINKFNSHLQSLRAIKADQLSQQITLSYGIDEKRTNVVQIPQDYYSSTEDPTRFKSLHCLLYPSIGKCPNR